MLIIIFDKSVVIQLINHCTLSALSPTDLASVSFCTLSVENDSSESEPNNPLRRNPPPPQKLFSTFEYQ